jgi:hypothetical protein
LNLLFDWVRLLKSRIELTEAVGQERLAFRCTLGPVNAEFLGNLESQTLHEYGGPQSVGHLLVNFEIQLNRTKDTRARRENGVQDTDVTLSQKVVE